MPIEPYPDDCEINENPDSLVITYRGSQKVGRAVIYLLYSIFAVVFLVFILVPDIAQGNLSELTITPIIIICPGILLSLFIYGTYVSLAWSLDLMLDHEKITITTSSLTIEKSGFGSIHLSRKFYLKESDCFHPMFMARYMQEMITLSPSRFLARISQTGGGRTWLFTSPMRWFCRGLSKEELIAILTQIKGKFPNITVLMEYEPLVGPG